MRRSLPLLAALLMLPASAEDPGRDARGWLPGPVAAGASGVIAGIADADMPAIEVPKALLAAVDKPTVVLYFSPTCPHCRAVAHEAEGLSQSLKAHGAQLVWVSSGNASEADLQEFLTTYGVTGAVLRDTDREIVSAIAARSTPSALLVEPSSKKGKIAVRDVWYPYAPGMDGLVLGRVSKNPFVDFAPGVYQGANHCGACHVVEHLSWGATHHAKAWYTLELKSKQTDPACTGCHVTGNGQPTGWDGDPHSPLVDVGCEACHGPGGPHDGERSDPKEACTGCHDAEHSIAFSLDKGVPLIDHYFADHMSEKDYDERRRQLYKGELPRELLAFPEGKQIGAAACQACHPQEHASWSISAHASAMGRLDKDDKRKDPDCVKCHATAKTSGLPPSQVSEFHVLDGVGCESCHGPGEAHAAAPTAQNIEGLGEDCPVCVIEAVCTSCHTAKWDPTWNLEDKLPKAGHGKR